MIKKYVRKPELVEVMVYDGENDTEIVEFANKYIELRKLDPSYLYHKKKGTKIFRGDYIVKSCGEVWVYDPYVFSILYTEFENVFRTDDNLIISVFQKR